MFCKWFNPYCRYSGELCHQDTFRTWSRYPGSSQPPGTKTVGRTTPKFTFFRGCAPLSIQTVDQSLVPNGEFFYSKKLWKKN